MPPQPHKKSEPSDADLVIEALYQVAADPTAWDQLAAVLDPDGVQGVQSSAVRRSPQIAHFQSRLGEGAMPAAAGSDLGCLIVSVHGRVLAANGQGAATMASLGAYPTVGELLRFDDPNNLDAAMRSLDLARGAPGPVILRLERPGKGSPCFAYAASAESLPQSVAATFPRALCQGGAQALVFPAGEAATRLWTSLRQSFGLTEAEVRLARALRDGQSLQEAAQELRLSINTVRNQLRAIFDKMGLQRQSDLVGALADLSAMSGAFSPPLSAPSGPLANAPPVQMVRLKDGRHLGYREYGSTDPAAPVLFSFHEGLGSSLLPPQTQGRARALGLRIIAADRPGFGKSDPRDDYSFDAVAQDMVELCDQLGIGRMRVGAVLSGAAVALRTAIALGDRVELVMLCSGRPPGQVLGGSQRNRSLLAQFRSRLLANPWVIDTLYAILRIRISHAMTRQFMGRAAAHSRGDLAYLEDYPEAVDYVWTYASEALGRTSRGPTDEIKAFRVDHLEGPVGLTAPVIVWHGAEDVMAPLGELTDYLGDHAVEVRVIDGIGHMMALKYWYEILERVAAEPPEPRAS